MGVRAFRADWRGSIMVNDGNGYQAQSARGATGQNCLVHGRRGCVNRHAVNGGPIAAKASRHRGPLHAIAQQAAGRKILSEHGPRGAGASAYRYNSSINTNSAAVRDALIFRIKGMDQAGAHIFYRAQIA
jgi:hypothetical protein